MKKNRKRKEKAKQISVAEVTTGATKNGELKVEEIEAQKEHTKEINSDITKDEGIKTEQTKEIKSQELKTIETNEVETQKNKEVTEEKKLLKKKCIWVVPLVMVILLGLGVGAYCSIAVYYQTHYFQNTYINNMNSSHLEAVEVAAYLDSQALAYQVELIGRDEKGNEVSLGVISASDIGYAYTDTLNASNTILKEQNEWKWLSTLGNDRRDYSLVQGVTFDSTLLREALMSLDAFQEKNMIAPKDAYISGYMEEVGGYEIVPEMQGTLFNVEHAISCVEAAVVGDSATKSVTVNLVEQGCYLDPEITSDNKKLVSSVETMNQWLSTEIIYDWNGNEVIVDHSIISTWASLVDGKPKLDEDAVAEFVNKNANEYDTTGKRATFTTTLGIQLSLPRLSYGWKTDRAGETEALIGFIKEGSKQEREPLYIRKGVWKGENDIGSSYIEADLTNQHLYIYEKGTIVFETDFVSGDINKPDCVSPAGIFGLTYKKTNAVLRGADYVQPVSYWMPFYGNFGMHDATWRDSFGGEIYLTNGSHGCLNLPLDAAAQIFEYVYEGSPIICYYY